MTILSCGNEITLNTKLYKNYCSTFKTNFIAQKISISGWLFFWAPNRPNWNVRYCYWLPSNWLFVIRKSNPIWSIKYNIETIWWSNVYRFHCSLIGFWLAWQGSTIWLHNCPRLALVSVTVMTDSKDWDSVKESILFITYEIGSFQILAWPKKII